LGFRTFSNFEKILLGNIQSDCIYVSVTLLDPRFSSDYIGSRFTGSCGARIDRESPTARHRPASEVSVVTGSLGKEYAAACEIVLESKV